MRRGAEKEQDLDVSAAVNSTDARDESPSDLLKGQAEAQAQRLVPDDETPVEGLSDRRALLKKAGLAAAGAAGLLGTGLAGSAEGAPGGGVIAFTNVANTFVTGPQTVRTGAATNKGAVVQGAAGQTAALLEVQDSSGNVLMQVDSSGKTTLNKGPETINTGADTNAGLIIKRNSPSQSANLLDAQDENSSPLFSIGPSGDVSIKGPRPWADVRAYGATGDGTTNDSDSIQAAIDAVAALPYGGTVYFPPGRYLIQAPGLHLPKFQVPLDYGISFSLVGEGAELYTDQAITILDRPMPTSFNDAVGLTSYKWRFSGLRFIGTSLPGQVGLRLNSTLGAIIENCSFDFLDTGLRAIFCLMMEVRSCRATGNLTDCYYVASGDGEFNEGTPSNSGSNDTVFRNCHANTLTGSAAGFRFIASGNILLDSCVTEGGNPTHGVYWANGGSSCARFLTIRNHWCEHSPTGAAIRFRGPLAATLVVDGAWIVSRGVLVDTTGCVSSRFWLDRVSLGEGPNYYKGETAGGIWYFNHPELDPSDPANWVGGMVGSIHWEGDDLGPSTGVHPLGATTRHYGHWFQEPDAGWYFQTSNGLHGFFGHSPVARPNVTGAKGGNDALASLLAGLADLGLIVDNTT